MPPPTEYIKINTDGAFGANNSGTGGLCGVGRGEDGTAIFHAL